MALEVVFQNLCLQCQKLHEAMSDLRLTIVEDKPLAGDLVLIERFSNTVDDVLGWLEEMYSAARGGRRAVDPPVSRDQARRHLTTCQQHFNHLTQRFATDLAAHDRLEELLRAGRERRGEWQAWTESVKQSIESCQHLFFDFNQVLFSCWQEVSEQREVVSVSVCAPPTDKR